MKEKENGDCTNLVFSGSVFIDKSCLGLTNFLIIGINDARWQRGENLR